MRIATSQYQSTMSQSLQLNQERVNHLMSQMASGQRILLPSDDPVGAVRLSRLQRAESTLAQYRSNIATANDRMTKDETYLTSMANDMIAGRDLMLQASDGGATSADLNSLVSPLSSLRDSLLATANTVDAEGHYIFSGTLTDQPAISLDATTGKYSYRGNTGDQTVVVASGRGQVVNQNLKGIEDLLNQLDQTIAAFSAPNAVSSDPVSTLGGFDKALDLVSGKIASIGSTQNSLATLDANHANVSLSNQTAIVDLGSVDMAQAATDLTGYTNALQATYKTYSKISTLSLFAAL